MLKIMKTLWALIMVVFYALQVLAADVVQVRKNTNTQNDYMSYLKNEHYVNYTPCDESKLASFDINDAIKQGVKYNEVAFIATHNSYQTLAAKPYQKIVAALDNLTNGAVNSKKADFDMDTLTEQLELGIRSLEIDISPIKRFGKTNYIVCHFPFVDSASSCYDLEKALEEIKLWSDKNPGHMPISIIIEPKNDIPAIFGLKKFTADHAAEVDKIIREKLGDALLTPKDMMGNYENLKQMRENDGWLPLKDTMGKVLILLHDCNATDDYINQDITIKSQAMFPMLRYNDRYETYASFILDNDPASALNNQAETIDKCNLVVRTRADSYPNFSDERYAKAYACSAQIITTDYPIRAEESKYHIYSFNGYTMKLVK